MECCVCMGRMVNPCTYVACKHMACMRCMAQAGSVCPQCRRNSPHVHLPHHNRAVWQLCGQDRGRDQLAAFVTTYQLGVMFFKWAPLHDALRVPYVRFRRVFETPVDIRSRINGMTVAVNRLSAEVTRRRAQTEELVAEMKRIKDERSAIVTGLTDR